MSTAPRVAATSPFTGKTLGRCKIGRPIGRGATATVFHATYLPLKKDVAVKILRPEAAGSADLRNRFIEEARSLAKLDHPNVVKVFDVVEDEGYLLIIMDFVKGRTLLEVVDGDGAMDPEEAVDCGRQIALALDHAHGQRILHRDVKPGNAILADDGKVVLVDFGNAEAVGEAADRKGTAHYVAPEVFQGKHQDEKSDTYSLGATLFHLLTGEPPFGGQSVKEILEAHEAGKVRAPSQVNPEAGIPKELDTLVKRSMAAARGYRFAAKDLAAALESVVDAVRAGPRVRTRKGRGRAVGAGIAKPPSKVPVMAGAAVLVVAVAVAAIAAFRHQPEEAPKPSVAPVAKKEEAAATGTAEARPHDYGIGARADVRAAREEAAAKALKDAYEFAAKGMDQPKAVADRFAAVASEYAEMGEGRKAREEEKLWRDKAMTGEQRAAREAEKQSAADRDRKVLEDALKKVADAVAGMRFAEALAALQDIESLDRKADEWKRRQDRLELLAGLTDLIADGLQGNPVSCYDIHASFAQPGEKVFRVGEMGLILKSTAGERTVPWTDAKPPAVIALARKVLPNRPEPRLALAAYCWETGNRDDAKKEIDTAMLTDRTGTVAGRIEELFGPEEQR